MYMKYAHNIQQNNNDDNPITKRLGPSPRCNRRNKYVYEYMYICIFIII